ncbi:hypothetical protein [Nocardioides sp.]|uniref:hypothetical protein n=1 Tax=Nocardioides sp. TaxID=35761 RepID=UPI00286DF21D|nr:hypothetical protein [Nocardioides sp.]
MTSTRRELDDLGFWASARPGACVALGGSALIHSTVMGEHLAQWVVAGLFFLALVGVETALALAVIYAWGRRTAQAVVLTGVVTVAVWLVSRTVGLPVGPADLRVPEAVGVPDLASCLLELGAAALAWRTAVSTAPITAEAGRRSARSPGRWLTVAITMVALTITAWGVRPALTLDDPPAHHQRGSSS